MSKRFVSFVAIAAATLSLALPAVASATPQPWWQIVTGSRPSNLWIPQNEVQELQKGGFITIVFLEGSPVACLGAFCGFLGMPNSEAPADLQTALEAPGAYGPGNVEVAEEPAGSGRYLITSVGEDAGQSVPGLSASPPESSSVKVIQVGGSGRMIVTLSNIGDATLDATKNRLEITDEMPAGVAVLGVEARAGNKDESGPVDCEVKANDLVSCHFEGTLPPYEAIEVETYVKLEGEPPAVSGASGEVTVSGGNAQSKSESQPLRVGEQTPFGIERFSTRAEEEGGGDTARAGAHPFQVTNTIQFNAGTETGTGQNIRVKQPAMPRNLRFPLPAGLVGDVSDLPQCTLNQFFVREGSPFEGGGAINHCPDASAVGVSAVTFIEPLALGYEHRLVPVFNLVPGPGEPARFGFVANGLVPVVIDTEVDPDHGYRLIASVSNTTQLATLLSSTLSIWGTPGDPAHDLSRSWGCLDRSVSSPCQPPSGIFKGAFLRAPVSCEGPLVFDAEVEPWNAPPGSTVAKASSEGAGLHSCNQVPFDPSIAASTSKLADSPSGLDFQLTMPNANLNNPAGIAEAQPKKVEVTLPEGVTINPSAGEGLAGCTPAEYAREKFDSSPGEGCPEASKIGSVKISTPLLKEEATGAVYQAAPYDNPSNSLLGLYVVAKIPDRGVLVKQAGKVEPDPHTGRIVTTFENLPQLPFSSFQLHFREGARAPLVTPPACGPFQTEARFTPWSAQDPNNPAPDEVVTRTSSPFTIEHGVNGGPCPTGTPPFKPGFTAGTEDNAGGSYSPFKVRLTREDGEQEFSRFSLKLPKGVIGNLSGIPFCSEAAIAQARSRTGVNGGQEELDNPSCPAGSQIGRTLVGAGVGPSLTYVPGKLYLAGPYQGAKLSAVAITPAKVGPFDLGDVVIRQALKVDPVTAEVSTDGSSSDPIPHILQGIVVHARDIRVIVDRKDFVLNPTSCERMTASASVSGLSAVDVSSPFQAADCASLGFKPKLSLSLSGGTKRTGHPRLKAVLKARKGDANIREAVVALPHSEFLEQSHIRTICTRVQFNAGGGNGEQCPKGSIYGRVKAVTPLLDEPLSGPVYLRSSNHPLPDLVAALHSGKVDINLDGRIDSINGGIRNSFEAVPDAPVTKFTLEMQGGKKGLFVNSTDICRGTHRASATFTGQNGKRLETNPLLKAKCSGKKKRKKP